jgi:nucleoside-diphosphate-sugar epimerase
MAAKKIVAITGASGRIGRFVAKQLLEKGYTVRGIIKRKEQLLSLPAGTIPYLGDINNKKALNDALDGADAVIHFAAIVSEYKYTTESLLETNVVGTRSVVEACEDNGVRQLIFPSTVDVYGRTRKENLTEDSPMQPTDKYGYSKMLAENVIKEESGSIDYTIFRVATAYGPGFETSFFKLLRLIKDGKAYLIGSGNNHLVLVHVIDAARAFTMAIENRKASAKKVYNLSDGENRTQKYIFDLAADLLGAPKPKKQISNIVMNLMAKTRNIDSDELRFLTSNRILNTEKIKRELGFGPEMTLRKGVEETVRLFVEGYKEKDEVTVDTKRG